MLTAEFKKKNLNVIILIYTYPFDSKPGVIAIRVEGADSSEWRPFFFVRLAIIVLSYFFTTTQQ